MCAFYVFLQFGSPEFTLYFLRVKPHINTHKIHAVFQLFPNPVIVLQQTHVFKTCVRVGLIISRNLHLNTQCVYCYCSADCQSLLGHRVNDIYIHTHIPRLPMYAENHELIVVSPMPAQHHRVHSSFTLLHICDFLP